MGNLSGRSDQDRAQARVNDLLANGERRAALRVAEEAVSLEASLQNRWMHARVLPLVGRAEEGLGIALQLDGTEAWSEVSTQVWDMAVWAGRADIAADLIGREVRAVEEAGDLAGVASWPHVCRSYLGAMSLLGRTDEAAQRLEAHQDFEDSALRLSSNPAVQINRGGDLTVQAYLPSSIAAVQGRYLPSGQFDEEYEQLLSDLFGLDDLSPEEAWRVIDEWEQRRTLYPLASAYRAMQARRGGNHANADQWNAHWFAAPDFPLSLHDLVVTGLLAHFWSVREQWLAWAAESP